MTLSWTNNFVYDLIYSLKCSLLLRGKPVHLKENLVLAQIGQIREPNPLKKGIVDPLLLLSELFLKTLWWRYGPYYQCIEDYYEEFKRSYDRNFSQKYGYLRPHIEKVIYQYLDCGILHNGFVRIKCCECGHENLLSFSCKRRHFCPSCHAKRVAQFGEWLCSNVLKKVTHRHFVFSIPKILRIYFLFNRSLLKELSRISWEVIRGYYKNTCKKGDGNFAAVAVIQTFGDYLAFNPHMHILAADGCFSEDGFFYAPSINIDTQPLEKLFVHRIFKMLLAKGLITEMVVELILSWRHTGFGVYCGKRIYPKEARSTENLARYIIRASFS